jgi:inosine-uridine nucleoside N-ribohydrolase
MIDRFMEMDAEWLGERCILHDAVALSYLLEPSLLDVRPYWVGVECTGTLTRGMTVVDVRHFTKRSPNAQVAVDVDARRFVDLLVTRLGPA